MNEIWSAEKAAAWYDQQPWLVGCNFIPSTAVNQLETWQAETFDPDTMDRELGLAADLGMNAMRVSLHDLAWMVDPEGLKKRIERYLVIASKHGILTLFVLLDDCWDPDPKPGPQPLPVPGKHNLRWLQSPGKAVELNPDEWPRVRDYVVGVVASFAHDERVLGWDVFNELGNHDHTAQAIPLLRAAFD